MLHSLALPSLIWLSGHLGRLSMSPRAVPPGSEPAVASVAPLLAPSPAASRALAPRAVSELPLAPAPWLANGCARLRHAAARDTASSRSDLSARAEALRRPPRAAMAYTAAMQITR